MRKLILVLIGIAATGCNLETHRAQIEVEDGASVALVISPMFSLQSDWHRKLSIETPAGALVSDLFEDTGWWRGSNLYRHSSGAYVLHEGQAGCVLFRVSPPELISDPAISCKKTERTSDGDMVQTRTSPEELPASKFYKEFEYIGRFEETSRRQEPIIFIGADEKVEAELPEIL